MRETLRRRELRGRAALRSGLFFLAVCASARGACTFVYVSYGEDTYISRTDAAGSSAKKEQTSRFFPTSHGVAIVQNDEARSRNP